MSHVRLILNFGVTLFILTLVQQSVEQACLPNDGCLEQLGKNMARLIGKKVVIDEDPSAERLTKNIPKFDPDAPVIHTSKLQKPYRILRPNSAMTMDYLPNRINIFVDDHNKFIKATCG